MRLFLAFSLFCALALNGCATWEGLKHDFAGGGQHAAYDPDAEKKNLPVYDGVCPAASARPDLVHLVDTFDPLHPTIATTVSEATIERVTNICRIQNNAIVMQIDLTLSGRTGPKAREQATDKPSFAYPYFVAVTDAAGAVLSKEVFAATLAYDARQNEQTRTETIFQTMPVPDSAAGQSFTVVVGFQLSDEQLAYNRKLAGAPR